MSKRAERAASAAYPFVKRKFVHPYGVTEFDGNHDRRETFQEGYEQAEKDIWDRIEKYLKTRHHMDYATVGWILNNLEYYKQKIMEEE